MDFNTIPEILEFAIAEEEAAAAFYTSLAEEMQQASMKRVFLDFAREEEGHRAKLLAIQSGESALSPAEPVPDLRITDYLVEPESEGPLSYQDALIVAMKKEKSAFRLYTRLAESVEDAALRDTFLALAQEEAKHKLRFEVEYDEVVYQEN